MKLHESENALRKVFNGVTIGIEKGANLGITHMKRNGQFMTTQFDMEEIEMLHKWISQNYGLPSKADLKKL